jgi:hypothetical protein
VDLHAIEQVWQAMHRLMLKTAANWRFAGPLSNRYSISRPICQL